MRRALLLAAAAVALAAPSLAAAQPGPEGEHHGAGGQRGGAPAAAQPAPRAAVAAPAPQGAGPAGPARFDRRASGPYAPGYGGPRNPGQPDGGPRFRPGYAAGVPGPNAGAAQPRAAAPAYAGRPGYAQDYRGEARGFAGQPGGPAGGYRNGFRQGFGDGERFRGGWYAGDRRSFNFNGRTFYSFRADAYRWPDSRWVGYRWSRGAYLPRLFLIDDYFITDYYAFGLQPPPYGYAWVRVGYDVLLVNTYSGEVLDVVPGVFWG